MEVIALTGPAQALAAILVVVILLWVTESLPLPVTTSVRFLRWAFSVTTVTGFWRLQPVPISAAAIRAETASRGRAGRELIEDMESGSTAGFLGEMEERRRTSTHASGLSENGQAFFPVPIHRIPGARRGGPGCRAQDRSEGLSADRGSRTSRTGRRTRRFR